MTHNRSFRGAAGLLGLLGTLAGCSVGPDFKKPEVAVNPNWRGADPRVAAQVAADADWWKAFKDPALDRLIDLAYRQNLPLQIAGLRIVESRARLAIAVGNQFPQSQAAYGHAMAVGLPKQQATGLNLERNFFEFQAGFDATWELDFWGKYRRGVQAEAAGLMVSVAEYRSALVSLTAEVARTYTMVRTFQVLIEQAQANVTIQEEGLRIAEAHFKNGATSELDVTQATTLLESTRASIPQLQTGLSQMQNALSTLLGQQTGGAESLLAGPKQIPNAPAKVALSVPAEMLRRRPDIRSAEYQAASQSALIGVAKSDLYPAFSLTGTVGLQATNSTGAGGSNHFFSRDSLFYSVGPQVNWPILNYGRIKNNVRVHDARFQQSLVNYRDTVLRAVQEVEDALAGFLNAKLGREAQQAAVTAARRSVELAVIQYREGAVDFQRVLDAERSLLQEQNSLVEVDSSVATSFIAVYKALGGGWEFSQGQPYVPEQTRKEMKERTDWGDTLSEPRSPETEEKPVPRFR